MASIHSFSRSILAVFLFVGSTLTIAAQPQSGVGKAVWEPINYPKDISVRDIFFVNATTGWICGGKSIKGGFLMGTTDGGATWTNSPVMSRCLRKP